MEIKKTQINNKTLQIVLETDADKSVFDEILVDKDYKDLEKHLKETPLPVIDIGAHIGIFAVYAAYLNSKLKIFAYEPDERNYKLAKENIKKNRLQNVQIKNYAISDIDGEITFYVNEDSHNHSIFSGTKGQVEDQTITSRPLSKIAKAPKYSLLKLDAEGAEYPIILNSDDEVLKKFEMIYIEYHDHQQGFTYKKLVQKLKNAGFKTQQKPSIYDNHLGFILASQL